MNLRWRDRNQTWRAGDRIRPSQYDVELMESDSIARAFVEQHHYSRSYPAAKARVGLYRLSELVGVAVFSVPPSRAVLERAFPDLEPYVESVELGRFVLLDEVPANGESWFLARAFELIRDLGIRGVVSFSDPIERTNELGRPVFPGHVGTIYQASNAVFAGRGEGALLRILPDGTSFHKRARQKIRAAEVGWTAAAAILQRFGAEPIDADADRPSRLEWLERAEQGLVRRLRHPGNLRYLFGLDRAVKRLLGPSLAYPKLEAA